MSARPDLPDDELERRVLAHLDDLAADYEIIRIDPAHAETAEFCARYGYELDESANCIIVASRSEPRDLAACLNLATTKLDVNKRVRKLMGVRKLSFATEEDTRAATGMRIGGVTPFALPPDLPLYVDRRVVDRESVIVGGGSRSLKIRVGSDVFTRMEGADVVDDRAVTP
jgi:prolyl-tRNA editing enzyme YbaK/EbsC (Cys-tRNA(Pro) deacylase)